MQQQPTHSSGGFSESELEEARMRSLNPFFNASYHHSAHSRDCDMNVARRQSWDPSLNASKLSFGFNQHSHSAGTPTDAGLLKTPDDSSSPEQ